MDIAFGLPIQGGAPKSHSQYVRNLKATDYNQTFSTKFTKRNKSRFNKAVRESTRQEGDHVLGPVVKEQTQTHR